MSRGRRLEPHKECEFCNKPLPALRHPATRYCNPTCRGRDRYQRDYIKKGIKCLVCGNIYARVGSHVVQVHGYPSTLEYRREFGLMARETRIDEHAAKMSKKATTIENLKHGKDTRYVKGGDHAERLREFWRNREAKLGTRKRHIPFNGEKLE